MSFKISESGSKQLTLALLRLRQSAPKLLKSAVNEIDRRHAAAYRRRFIPRDTGALQASLRFVGAPGRQVVETESGVEIGTLIPYAKYQRQRIRELSRVEKREIFVLPVLEEVRELLTGRRG